MKIESKSKQQYNRNVSLKFHQYLSIYHATSTMKRKDSECVMTFIKSVEVWIFYECNIFGSLSVIFTYVTVVTSNWNLPDETHVKCLQTEKCARGNMFFFSILVGLVFREKNKPKSKAPKRENHVNYSEVEIESIWAGSVKYN